MTPKTPNSYRIPEPIRSEVLALMKDLDLVLVRKSFVPFPSGRFRLDDSARVRLDINPVKVGISCQSFMNRNHHRKCFTNVYPSNNDYKVLSFDWCQDL